MRFLASFLLIITCFSGQAHAISPGTAGTLSLVPGLGQAVNGKPLEGLGWFAASAGLYFGTSGTMSDIGYKIWSYNIYDAYRGAGAQDTSKNTPFEDYVAFVNPLNIIDPISVGVIGYGAYSARTSHTVHSGPENKLTGAIMYGFVGFGEEGLFRGALFPGLSHVFNSYVAGAVLSSALFSASHLTNKAAFYHSAKGLLTLFAGGMVFCLQTKLNHFDLRHSIFTHAWYDFIVDYASLGASANIQPNASLRIGFLF